MTDVLHDLRAIVGDDHVLTDADVVAGHVTDWTGRFSGTTPAVVRPGSTAEVADIIALCRRRHIGLVPQGGNTGLVGGSVPRSGEVVVHLGRLDEIVDVDPVTGQLTAGAGATIGRVQRAATAAGWRYGIDFAARDSATIGGSIATNAGGLRVIRHGMTRRHVVGLEAVLGTGDVVSHLRGLAKDNTGYDLVGLLCGSEGTLGVVTRARLALVPAAGPTVTALVGCESVDAAVDLVARLRRAVPTLEAAELVLAGGVALVEEQLGVSSPIPGDAPVQVLVEAVGPPDPTQTVADVLEGSRSGGREPDVGFVAVAVATDPRRAAHLWEVRERHTEAINRLGVPHKFDVTVPLDRLATFVADVPGRVWAAAPGTSTWIFGHLADGNLHVNVTGGGDELLVADAVLSAVMELGGSISAEHGIGTAKRAWLGRNRGPGDIAAMRAVKAALDPDGVCNPGVLLG